MTLPLAYETFTIIATSFIVFSIVSILLLCNVKTQKLKIIITDYQIKLSAIRSNKVISLGLFLGILATTLSYYYHIGMTNSPVVLPFKLQGIIFTLNNYVATPLLGLAVIFAIRSGIYHLIRKTVILTILWGVLQFGLFVSKGSLIFPLLWIFFATLVTGLHQDTVRKYLIGGVSAFLLIIPFVGIYRGTLHKLSGSISTEILTTMVFMLDKVFSENNFIDILIQSLFAVSSRIVGFSELSMMYILYDIKPHSFIEYMFSGDSAGGVLTNTLGIEGTGFAASMLGQAYYATGSILGTALWVGVWTIVAFTVSLKLLSSRNICYQSVWVLWVISATYWSIDELGTHKLIFFLVSCTAVVLTVKYLEKINTKIKVSRKPIPGSL